MCEIKLYFIKVLCLFAGQSRWLRPAEARVVFCSWGETRGKEAAGGFEEGEWAQEQGMPRGSGVVSA
jgi:hypothetical protein